MSEHTYEWFFFGAVLLVLFSLLFIFLGTRMIKSNGNRVAAAIVCLGLALLLVIPLLKNVEVLEFLHERIALYCLGLVIATVSIVSFFNKS